MCGDDELGVVVVDDVGLFVCVEYGVVRCWCLVVEIFGVVIM